jgi:hypothetical protein
MLRFLLALLIAIEIDLMPMKTGYNHHTFNNGMSAIAFP